MKITIRPEKPVDIEAIHYINEQAFGRKAEAQIVDKIRAAGAATISQVAIEEGRVVGHIFFCPVTFQPEMNLIALCLGPLAVLPGYQLKGIGIKLVEAGLKACREQGCDAVFLVGHPEYYPRFGFVRAKSLGFECEYEAPDEAWMVKELREGALVGKRGKVFFQPEFREGV